MRGSLGASEENNEAALLLTVNAAFKAPNLLLLGPEPAEAETDDEYDAKLLADPIGPAVEALKRNEESVFTYINITCQCSLQEPQPEF